MGFEAIGLALGASAASASAVGATAVFGTLSAATSVYSAQQAASSQSSAQKQAQANADKTASDADQASNKANQKQPDTSAILDAAQQAGKSGASGTMLTGPSGVDPNALNLGKNTLLGS